MTLSVDQLGRKKRAQAGFTLIELTVVVVIVAILAATLLNRVLFYQEQAEKAAMQQMVGTLRSALHMQIANLLVKGRENDIAHLAEQNPMSWLAEHPDNYRGEYYAAKPGDVVSGNWYFDLQNRNLIYLVNNDAHFRAAEGELNQVRFKVRLVREHVDVPVGSMQSADNIEGVVLEQVVAYRWF